MLFIAGNFAMPTAAPPTAVTTGTGTKTQVQIATATSKPIRIVKWGVNFATVPTAAVTCELIETGTVFATVTQHTATGVMPYDEPNGTPVSSVQLGTALTGYTASAEGTVVAYRLGDIQTIPAGVSQLTWEWSLGREFKVAPGRAFRLRTTTTTAVNALFYVIYDD